MTAIQDCEKHTANQYTEIKGSVSSKDRIKDYDRGLLEDENGVSPFDFIKLVHLVFFSAIKQLLLGFRNKYTEFLIFLCSDFSPFIVIGLSVFPLYRKVRIGGYDAA